MTSETTQESMTSETTRESQFPESLVSQLVIASEPAWPDQVASWPDSWPAAGWPDSWPAR